MLYHSYINSGQLIGQLTCLIFIITTSFDSTFWKQKQSNIFRQHMCARARTLARTHRLIILGKSFKPQHCAPKKTSICSKDHFRVYIDNKLHYGIYVQWYKTNINCFKFVWRLKWYPLCERLIVHFTRLPAREMEESNLSPRGYISTFTLINVLQSSKMSRNL